MNAARDFIENELIPFTKVTDTATSIFIEQNRHKWDKPDESGKSEQESLEKLVAGEQWTKEEITKFAKTKQGVVDEDAKQRAWLKMNPFLKDDCKDLIRNTLDFILINYEQAKLDKAKAGTGTCTPDSGKMHPIPEFAKKVEPLPELPEKKLPFEHDGIIHGISDEQIAINALIDWAQSVNKRMV